MFFSSFLATEKFLCTGREGVGVTTLWEGTMSSSKMTREALIKACVENEGYETPALNDQIYLHFKGFRRIENLEPYTELKALWLESNGIEKLENLDHLSKLRCLYLQQNLIQSIENIQNLVSMNL